MVLDTEMLGAGNAMPARIFGYDVLAKIGTGAGSRVYAVCDPRTGQVYAMKHVDCQSDRGPRYLEQLLNEYQIAARLRHHSLRTVVDFRQMRTLLGKPLEAALVMELVDGSPLDRFERPSVSQILQWFAELARVLESMHRLGYLHCDLKPANVLITQENGIKLIDLGQACRIGEVKKRLQGTPDFMAPEQVRCLPLTVRTDIFGLGATLYYTLSGKKLPTLMSTYGKNSFVLCDSIPAPADLNHMVPEAVSRLVMDCVHIDEMRRPGSMDDLALRLEIMALRSAGRFGEGLGSGPDRIRPQSPLHALG